MNVERGEIVHGFEIPMFFGPVGILPREHSNGDVSYCTHTLQADDMTLILGNMPKNFQESVIFNE